MFWVIFWAVFLLFIILSVPITAWLENRNRLAAVGSAQDASADDMQASLDEDAEMDVVEDDEQAGDVAAFDDAGDDAMADFK